MATYQELKKQLERLNGQVEAARVAEMQAAIDEIRAQIELYELAEHDLFPSSPRGRAPAWILGKKRERFLIEPRPGSGTPDTRRAGFSGLPCCAGATFHGLYSFTVSKPGVYTLVGTELDAGGNIVSPQRVDWTPGMAFVTPPGYWHAHFNESGEAAYVIPLQDAGLQTYLRALDIRFAH